MTHTPVEIYPGYVLTPDGRVLSVSSNWRGYGRRELVQKPNSDGYMRVRINVNGERKALFVHKLIAKYYLPPNPGGMQLRHLDGDKTHNNVENIVWGTAKENADDRKRHGRTVCGENSHFHRFTKANILEMRSMRNNGYRLWVIANIFDTSMTEVSRVCRRIIWKSI